MFSWPMVTFIILSELSPVVLCKAQSWTEAKILLVFCREGLLQKVLQNVDSLSEYGIYLFIFQNSGISLGYGSASGLLLSFLE